LGLLHQSDNDREANPASPIQSSPVVVAERVEIAMGDSPYPIVGSTELPAVMMPAALASSIDHDASELYCWPARGPRYATKV
jgi:hypothetical protein